MIKLISIPYIVEATKDMSVILIGDKDAHYSGGYTMLAAKYEAEIGGGGVIIFDKDAASTWDNDIILRGAWKILCKASRTAFEETVFKYNKANPENRIIYTPAKRMIREKDEKNEK